MNFGKYIVTPKPQIIDIQENELYLLKSKEVKHWFYIDVLDSEKTIPETEPKKKRGRPRKCRY